ncbi:hypothetical protein RHSIM_Rhsim09G0170500 [Rhododendron simsii]|uniref:Sugar phosphate transporter domain-containing protein n=1 Tax=Rhododendron simsii TaxID=118357 RepID=A0A834LFK1_RHOSS|nr:hypothetical protein RHSIM_Rhsim09G0170500 [Rhododendron simsii]
MATATTPSPNHRRGLATKRGESAEAVFRLPPQPEQMKTSVLRKILVSYMYVAIWIFLNFTMIVFNKYILDRKMFNWPFPISHTMIHMALCSSIAYLLVGIFPVVEPVSMSPN